MVAIYIFTTVLSAFLVFFIQPVIAKMALPILGGTPLVWNGCMLFFQAMLLAGYIYAHVLTKQSSLRNQIILHVFLLIAVVFTFPLYFDTQNAALASQFPLGWLLQTLFYAVGLPFLVISASAPLLQRWFARTAHPDAANPYFLYAASNAGSLLALLSYPLLIEPQFTLSDQLGAWQYGIALLGAFFVMLGWQTYTHAKTGVQGAALPALTASIDMRPVTWSRRAYWVVLAFIPSSLLYGVTAYITTDLFSAPLLWLLPLTLYLVTFILVFERNMCGYKMAEHWQPLLVFAALFMLVITTHPFVIILHIATFFCVTLYIHGRLSLSKPGPQQLTEFFLLMSLGGVLGGIFNTFLAPQVFNSMAEYPLLLLCSILLRQPLKHELPSIKKHLVEIVIILVLYLLAMAVLQQVTGQQTAILLGAEDESKSGYGLSLLLLVAVAVVTAIKYKNHSLSWVLGVGGLLLLGSMFVSHIIVGRPLYQERGVFGLLRVYATKDDAYILLHGTTTHGLQPRAQEFRYYPTTYYAQLEPVFAAMAQRSAPVAAMGLGIGTVACYRQDSQRMDFYEIDPLVIEVARNTEYFDYLQHCAPDASVYIGDARYQIAQRASAGEYGLIIADTFSSDSIPVHMLTKEAVILYMDKLAAEGLLAIHISNRHVNLAPVVAGIVEALDLHAVIHEKHFIKKDMLDTPPQWINNSTWVVIAADEASLAPLKARQDIPWVDLPPAPQESVWTDDFSNVFQSLNFVRRWRGTAPDIRLDKSEAVHAEE